MFRQHLIESGSSEEEADAMFGIVLKLQRERTDWTAILFDKVYSHATPGFRLEPNALLVTAVDGVKPGVALEVAMGQGRNAVFLAANGWDVTGFDLSREGLAIAERDAAEIGVSITTLLADHRGFDYGSGQWDLIVSTYSVAPLTDPGHVGRLGRSLRSGGMIVVESFASGATETNRRPVDLDPAELRGAFREFEIRHFEDVEDTADWAPGESSRIVRMIAIRP